MERPVAGSAPARSSRRAPADVFETPDLRQRRFVREVVERLENHHTLAPDPSSPDKMLLKDSAGTVRRRLSASLAAAAQAAWAERQARRRDLPRLPSDADGTARVDLAALVRRLGLPEAATDGPVRVTVTADMAQALLKLNTSNRPLNPDTVRRYTRLMDDGRWMYGTDAIGIDREGRLVNGQHRLTALLDVCQPQPFMVTVGLDPEAFAVLDAGKRRQASDALAIGGFSLTATRAALIRMLASAADGKLWTGNRSLEAAEVLEMARHLDGERMTSCLSRAKTLYTRSRRLVLETSFAFLLWTYGEEHSDDIEVYTEQLATGVGIVEDRQPAATVRTALISERTIGGRFDTRHRLALVVRGAEAHLAGRPLHSARTQNWPSVSAPAAWAWKPQAHPHKPMPGRASTTSLETPV